MPTRKRAVQVSPLCLAIHERPLLSAEQATALSRLFKIFSNVLRLRLLHALVREGELYVSELAEAVGMRPQAVSNQLQRLVDRDILSAKREGTNVCYSILDPCVPVLLERGVCLTQCCLESR